MFAFGIVAFSAMPLPPGLQRLPLTQASEEAAARRLTSQQERRQCIHGAGEALIALTGDDREGQGGLGQ